MTTQMKKRTTKTTQMKKRTTMTTQMKKRTTMTTQMKKNIMNSVLLSFTSRKREITDLLFPVT